MPVQVHPGDDVCQLSGLVKDHHGVVQGHVHVGQLPVVRGCMAEWKLSCEPNTAHLMQPVLASLTVGCQDEACCACDTDVIMCLQDRLGPHISC